MANDPQASQSAAAKAVADSKPTAPAQAQPEGQAAPQQAQAQASEGAALGSLSKAAWRERARASFDVSPIALDGALHDQAEDAELTEDQVREAVDRFSVTEGV